jgi:hypothetical protein
MRAFFANADFRISKRAEWFLPPEERATVAPDGTHAALGEPVLQER